MVKEEELNAIIEAGTYAATGMGKQSPIIIAVTDKEEFDSDFGKDILKKLGIIDEYEGIGHCALGYAAAPAEEPAPRKENYVYYL